VVAAWADSGPRVAVISVVSIGTSLLPIIVAMDDAVGVEGSFLRTWERDEVVLLGAELTLVAAELSMDALRFLRVLSEVVDLISMSWEKSLSATEREHCELGVLCLAVRDLMSAWRDVIVEFSLANSAINCWFVACSEAIIRSL
jgi:hypothetical protein